MPVPTIHTSASRFGERLLHTFILKLDTVDLNTDNKPRIRDPSPNLVNNLKDKPTPIIQIATILVRALVRRQAQELREQVAMCAMDLESPT